MSKDYILKNYADDNFYWNIVPNPDLGLFDTFLDVHAFYGIIMPEVARNTGRSMVRLKERCVSYLRERLDDEENTLCGLVFNGIKPVKVNIIYNLTKEADNSNALSVRSTRKYSMNILRGMTVSNMSRQLVHLCTYTGLKGKFDVLISNRKVGDVRINPEYKTGEIPMSLVFGYVSSDRVDEKNKIFDNQEKFSITL